MAIIKTFVKLKYHVYLINLVVLQSCFIKDKVFQIKKESWTSIVLIFVKVCVTLEIHLGT
jgi:hypothetical protein